MNMSDNQIVDSLSDNERLEHQAGMSILSIGAWMMAVKVDGSLPWRLMRHRADLDPGRYPGRPNRNPAQRDDVAHDG
jgi:hypothetical protein